MNLEFLCVIFGVFATNIVLTKPLEKLLEDELFPTTKIIELPPGHFPEPNCHYTVHFDARTGPKVSRYEKIREKKCKSRYF